MRRGGFADPEHHNKGAPGIVTQAQLDELNIAVTATEEEEEA